MSIHTPFPAAVPSTASMPASPLPREDEGVAPSQSVDWWLKVIVALSLGTSMIGIAFVYGFNAKDFLTPENIVPGVRATIADSIMFCGVYFSRRFLTVPSKTGWHQRWGGFWLVIALGATFFSWVCNVLAVNEVGTVVTSELLAKSGLSWLDVNVVNQIIAALPIAAVLIYAFVPRQPKVVQRVVDTRTPEEIRAEWERDQALLEVDMQRRHMLAQQRGQGVGSTIAAAHQGLFAGLGRDEAATHAEHQMADQMRVLLVRHGYKSEDQARKMKDQDVPLAAAAQGLWDPEHQRATAKALAPTYSEQLTELRKEAIQRGWLTEAEMDAEEEMTPPQMRARYEVLGAKLAQARQEEAEGREALETEEEERKGEDEGASEPLPALGGAAGAPLNAAGALVVPRYLTAAEIERVTGKVRRTINNAMQTGALPLAQATFEDSKRRVAATMLIKKGWLPPETPISGKTGLKLRVPSGALPGNEPGKGAGKEPEGTCSTMAPSDQAKGGVSALTEAPHHQEQESWSRVSK